VISVLLPTVRPALAQTALASIDAAAAGTPYEVIVVADFSPETAPDERVHWIAQERQGVIAAVNRAYADATGDFVFLFCDESTPAPGALRALRDEAERQPMALLTPRHDPPYTFVYYGFPFAPFPFAHRDLIARLGGLLDPAYKCFYADPDLGMRAHAHDVPVVTVEQAVIHHYNGHDDAKVQNLRQYFAADQAVFKARWAHLGEFCDC